MFFETTSNAKLPTSCYFFSLLFLEQRIQTPSNLEGRLTANQINPCICHIKQNCMYWAMNGLFLVEAMNCLHHLSTKPRNICRGLSIFGIAHIISLQVGWDTVKHNASCRKEWKIHIGFHHNKFGPICMNDIYVLNFNYSAHRSLQYNVWSLSFPFSFYPYASTNSLSYQL